jgi:hypothetical protein
MDELVVVAASAGKAFNWSQKYVDLLATSAGAVFRSEQLVEGWDSIDVDLVSVLEQSARLKLERQAHGSSPRTISSYVSAWKRLATVARAWSDAGRPASDDPFWAQVAIDLADTRVRRLVGRSRPDGAVALSSAMAESVVEIRFKLSGGDAALTLPTHFTERDVLDVIKGVAAYGVRHAIARHDEDDSDEGA